MYAMFRNYFLVKTTKFCLRVESMTFLLLILTRILIEMSTQPSEILIAQSMHLFLKIILSCH